MLIFRLRIPAALWLERGHFIGRFGTPCVLPPYLLHSLFVSHPPVFLRLPLAFSCLDSTRLDSLWHHSVLMFRLDSTRRSSIFFPNCPIPSSNRLLRYLPASKSLPPLQTPLLTHRNRLCRFPTRPRSKSRRRRNLERRLRTQVLQSTSRRASFRLLDILLSR